MGTFLPRMWIGTGTNAMQKCSANFGYGYGRTSHKSLHLPVLYKQQTKNILAENTAFLALTKKAFSLCQLYEVASIHRSHDCAIDLAY